MPAGRARLPPPTITGPRNSWISSTSPAASACPPSAYGQVHVAALLELPDQSRSVRVRALVTDVRVSENTILSAARQSDPIISTNLLVRRTLVR